MDETWILSHFGPADVIILAWQIGLFLITLSIFVLMKRIQLSLITTYLFTLYWGFYLYWGNYIVSAGASTIPVLVYAFFGILQAALTTIAFYQDRPKASSPEGEKSDSRKFLLRVKWPFSTTRDPGVFNLGDHPGRSEATRVFLH